MRVAAVSGSIRSGSVNAQLLAAAALVAPPQMELIVWSELAAVPAFTPDADELPAAVRSLRRAIDGSDAVLIASPEYNFSMPGHLKNAIDWASHPIAASAFAGKPTAVIGASSDPTSEARWSRHDLRRVLTVVGAEVLESDLLILRADAAFAADGHLRAVQHRAKLQGILADLASAVASKWSSLVEREAANAETIDTLAVAALEGRDA